MQNITQQAFAYWNGDGVEKDIGKAFSLFEQGAAQGDANCMYIAGIILQDGLAGRFDRALAFDYIEKAAGKGHVDAIYSLGYFYLNGGMGNIGYSKEILNQKKVEMDENKGRELMEKAARHDHELAILNLARFFRAKAKENPEHAPDALKWYSRGIAVGEASCMVDMADMHILGSLVKEDRREAKKLYEQAKRSKTNFSARDAAKERLKDFDDLKSILNEFE